MKEIGLTERFERALTMATRLHRAQIRKGTERTPVPYLAHLLEVTAIVLGESVPEDVVIAALLHDGQRTPVAFLCEIKFGNDSATGWPRLWTAAPMPTKLQSRPGSSAKSSIWLALGEAMTSTSCWSSAPTA